MTQGWIVTLWFGKPLQTRKRLWRLKATWMNLKARLIALRTVLLAILGICCLLNGLPSLLPFTSVSLEIHGILWEENGLLRDYFLPWLFSFSTNIGTLCGCKLRISGEKTSKKPVYHSKPRIFMTAGVLDDVYLLQNQASKSWLPCCSWIIPQTQSQTHNW